ncbi:MAG TPA: BMP family ABC transporter substrate-binding protein [Desulfurococcales archaeon]|nr:BMP family ABC transporter substrate-binding protein [Desulfurococcales archaeon]
MSLFRGISTTALVGLMVVLIIIVGAIAYYVGYSTGVSQAKPTTVTVTVGAGTVTTVTKTVTSTITITETVTTTPAVTPPRKPKIAVVSDIGGRGDLSFNDMAFKGADEAARDFGVEVVELISNVEADYLPNLRTAARDPDVVLIVGVGFLLSEALLTVAQEYPDKNFAGIDTYTQALAKEKLGRILPNMMDIKFEEHKGSALVGALAALLAAYYDYPHIGMVLGIEIPVLWKFEIGYKWGCYWALEEWLKKNKPEFYEEKKKVKNNILATPLKERVLWTYTGTFSDITKGYEAAKAMYEKGAVAVYNVAGPLGLGINRAVKEIAEAKGLEMGPPFWIGVDANQDWINPGFVIASMMKRVDKGVYYATWLVLQGKFREVVKKYDGVLTLGIGTVIEGKLMEGISISTLKDLDEFIQMGIEAEKLTGKKILPMPPEQIKEKVKKMRESIPSWIWEAVKELETLIREGKVKVPAPMSEEEIKYWREKLG